MKYVVTINNKRYEVEVEKGQAAVLNTTEIAASTVATAQPNKVQQDTQSLQPAVTGRATEEIKAPMPGAILGVNVTVGDKVKEGDVVVMLEAMKMENEITAHKSGVVVQVLVSKGAYVATNDVLVVIQ